MQTSDVDAIMIDLSPTLDDYSTLGLSNSAFNPTVHEAKDDITSGGAEPFTIFKIVEPTGNDLVDVNVFISFRTPYTKPDRVTDQLPVSSMLAKNVPYSMLNNNNLTQRLIKFAMTHARRQYPCCEYKTNNIGFQLTAPRLGYWKNPDTRCTDIHVCTSGQRIFAIKDLASDQCRNSVYLSISFLIQTETSKASDTHVSVNGTEFKHPSIIDSSSSENFNSWMSQLHKISALPQNFETLGKLASLAKQLPNAIRAAKPPAGRPSPAKMKASKSEVRSILKTKQDLRHTISKKSHKDLRKEIVHNLHRRGRMEELIHDFRKSSISKRNSHH